MLRMSRDALSLAPQADAAKIVALKESAVRRAALAITSKLDVEVVSSLTQAAILFEIAVMAPNAALHAVTADGSTPPTTNAAVAERLLAFSCCSLCRFDCFPCFAPEPVCAPLGELLGELPETSLEESSESESLLGIRRGARSSSNNSGRSWSGHHSGGKTSRSG